MENYDEIISSLTKRVYHLEQEVIRLGGKPYEAPAQAKNDNNASSTVEAAVTSKVAEQNKTAEQSKAAEQKKPAYTKAESIKKKDMENKIGKNLMAILASILIFFSLVLFAGIAFRYLSDTAKAVIMFIVSAAIAVFGIVKMPKKKESQDVKYGTFFTALAACGIGAIYITDLVAYFGFKCLPLIPFIISLAVWIIATMILAYKRSNIFIYICNAGLIIATVLTTLQFENSILGFVIYTVCLIALYLINRHENYNLDCFYFMQYPIMFIVLSSVVETNLYLYIVFALMLALVFAYANFAYKIELKQIPTNIITAVLNIAAIIRIAYSSSDDLLAYVSIALLLLTMGFYFVKHYKSYPVLFYVVYVITYLISTAVFFSTDMYIIVALVPYIAFLVVGLLKKDVIIRGGGYFAVLVSFLIHIEHFSFWPILIAYTIIMILTIVAVTRRDYNIADKYIQTLLILLFVLSLIMEDKLNGCFVFVIFVALGIFMNTKYYIMDYKTKENELSSQIIAYIMSGLLIICGLFAISSSNISAEIYQGVIYSIATLAICCINTKKLFDINLPEMIVGFYLSLKFTVLIYTILHRIGAASFIISVVGILIAIVCIILGFKVRHKSFRLYGLVCSLICVVKLILFDIKYDSFILRPVGFFVAGVLCFAISFIYSRLEKGAKS